MKYGDKNRRVQVCGERIVFRNFDYQNSQQQPI